MRLTALFAVSLFPILLASSVRAEPVPGNDSAVDFVNQREALWFNYKSPAIDEGYPFGRSNAANNARLDSLFTFTDRSTDYYIRNKRFIVEGDWYVVEWFYGAKDARTGAPQMEGSLCFGQIKDQMLVSWIEFFDDTVGEMQIAGEFPLYGPTADPFPWPATTYRQRVYRP